MSIKAWLPFSEGTDVSKCLRRASSWRWHWKNFGIFRKQYADTDCISRTILRLSIQLLFLKHWRIVQKGFLTKTAEKDTKHRGSHPKVFCKVDVLKNILRFTGSFFIVIATAQLYSTKPELRFKSCSPRVGDSRWWGSLTMVWAANKAKRRLSVNLTTRTIHHHHHHYHYTKHSNCYNCKYGKNISIVGGWYIKVKEFCVFDCIELL